MNAIGIAQQRGVTLSECAWLSILAIYCMNFLNYGVYVPLLLVPVVFIYFIRNKIDRVSLLLVGFSATYCISLYFYGLSSISSLLSYLVYPICCYLIGSELVKADTNYTKTYRLLAVVIGSLTLFGFLSLLKTISIYGGLDASVIALGGRMVVNYWGNNPITATGLNTYLALGLSLLFVSFTPDKTAPRYIRLLCFISFTICAYCALTLGNRTGIIIAIASAATVYLSVGKLKLNKILALVLTFMVSLTLRVLYQVDFLGLKTDFQETLLYARFDQMSIAEDPRYDAWKAALTGLFEHPMGGKETILQISYAHNMWLDVGYTAGIAPFLLLVIFAVASVRSLRKFAKLGSPIFLKAMFIALYTAFFITFFVEPIMEGWVTFFNVFCLIFGVIKRLNDNLEKAK